MFPFKILHLQNLHSVQLLYKMFKWPTHRNGGDDDGKIGEGQEEDGCK